VKPSLVLLSVSFLFSFSLVPLMKRIATRYGVLDYPNGRKVHKRPIALLGGAAVFSSFVLLIGGAIIFMIYWDKFPTLQRMLPSISDHIPYVRQVLPELGAILMGGAVVFAIGVIDDKASGGLGYQSKFLIQFLIAGVLAGSGIHTVFLPGDLLNMVITVLWIVGITNAFNLLDNMNGLSSGVALIAATIFSIVAIQQGQFFIQSILMVFIGALLGFLPYNFPRATIFLGDSGSLFIGYILGCLTVVESYITPQSNSQLAVILPLLVLGVPLLDTFTVITIRLTKGLPLFKGDKRHLSHSLVRLGMSPSQAVITLYLFTLIIGINSLLLTATDLFGNVIILSQAFLILVLILLLLFMRENSK
jgi:UDP-GlcNAc:undecaprenyl-phosphate GlcNAc-1-phosphate transferase